MRSNGVNLLTRNSVFQLVLGNVGPVAGIGVGVAVFQVLGVIISCFLAANMRRKDNYV